MDGVQVQIFGSSVSGRHFLRGASPRPSPLPPRTLPPVAKMVRKLKHHEQKLLKKVCICCAQFAHAAE